jgi:hypothetical protein
MMRFPNTDHDIDGLRRKFNTLASKKIPTGDPFIPPDVKKAKKIRNDLSQFSGLKTGSPEKMEINYNRINSKGGALDDVSGVFSSIREEELDFVGSEDSEEDDDNDSKNVARSNLRNMAKKGTTSKTMTPTTTTTTSTHPLVTREFSSTTFSKRRDQNKSKKKRRVDDNDDDDDNTMKTFMKMFMMQSERERIDREREREDRRRQEEVDREERRLQMAQAKATSDMMQVLLMRSMGMINTAAGSMSTTASATTDNSGENEKSASVTTDDSGANEKSGVKED